MNRALPRILILVGSDNLGRISKIQKLARSLSAAGYEVIRLGFKTDKSDPDEHIDGFGRVVLVAPAGLSNNKGEAGGHEASNRATSSARTLFGFVKEYAARWAAGRRLLQCYEGVRASWRRWRLASRTYRTSVSKWSGLSITGAALSPDIVIASQFPGLVPGSAIAESLGVPLIYDSRDLFCASNMDKPLARRFAMSERKLIQKADTVMTVTPQAAQYLADTYHIDVPLVVYNGSLYGAPEITPPHEPVRILFQGAFTPDRMLTHLVEAMVGLENTAVLTLQGWGWIEDELRQLVKALDLEEVVNFVAPAPATEVSLAAAEHDIGVVNLAGNTENHRVAAPNKLFDYLGGGLAVAGVDLPAIRDIVESAECGVIFSPLDVQSLHEGLLYLCSDKERLALLKHNARSAWDYYSWDSQATKVVDRVRELLPTMAADKVVDA